VVGLGVQMEPRWAPGCGGSRRCNGCCLPIIAFLDLAQPPHQGGAQPGEGTVEVFVALDQVRPAVGLDVLLVGIAMETESEVGMAAVVLKATRPRVGVGRDRPHDEDATRPLATFGELACEPRKL